MSEVVVSAKNRIRLPKEARVALGLKPGDRLNVVVRAERMIVFAKPKHPHKALRGLGKGLYGEDYLERERQSWD